MAKLILSIFSLLLTMSVFAQADTTVNLDGEKIPLHKFKFTGSGIVVLNDSTAYLDSSKFGVALQKNVAGDSIRMISGSGTVLSTVKDSGGTTDTTKLIVTNNNLGTTRDFTKGALLANYTPGALGAMQISPWWGFKGNSFASTPGTSIPIFIFADLLPVQGTSTGYGYVRLNYQANNGTITNGFLTFGTAGGNPSVGINSPPFSTSGAPLVVGGGVDITGDLSASSSSFSINNFGSKIFDLNSSYVRFASGTNWLGVVTNKPVSIGKLTAPTAGVELDMGSVTGRAFLPPVVTSTQRDSINLTVSSITVTSGGLTYSSTPSVAFTPGPMPTSSTTAVVTTVTRVGGVITAIPVAFPGSYNSTPSIVITGGGGSGATAIANMTQVLTAGMTVYCSNCTATDGSTGVMQTWNGSAWKNSW